MNLETRRTFIKHGAIAAAGTSFWNSLGGSAQGSPLYGGIGNTVLGANERVRVGIVGPGGRGTHLMGSFLEQEDVEFLAVCDIDDARILDAQKKVEESRGTKPEGYRDFRKLIDRDDLDAVIVATPDHWHALPTIYSCQTGKDVYCEKPLATSIGEGRAMLEAARASDRIVQMGTQWKSAPHMKEAMEYLHSGKIGKVRQVRCWAYLDWSRLPAENPGTTIPEGVDYDLWLGPSPKRDFDEAHFHYTFRWFWDYAGGLMTDWGVHLLNIAMWGMGSPNPNLISSTGGRFIYPDRIDTPDTQQAIYQFDDFILIWEHQMKGGIGPYNRPHGMAFSGKDALLIVDGESWEVIPEKDSSVEAEKHEGEDAGHVAHVRNFLDCVKSREKPAMDIEIGHNVSTVAHLGNLAYLSKDALHWNPESERVTNNSEADSMVTKAYRQPWKLG